MRIINIKALVSVAVMLFAGSNLMAKEVIGLPTSVGGQKLQRKAAACEPATFQADLDINNVRARILNGGDMWWDLNSVAKYEIPKVNDANTIRKNSLFAGAIWIGGLDPGGNLKVAAMTYRQSGSDYYPGPLDTAGSASTEAGRCKFYDKIFKINRTDLMAFVDSGLPPTDDIRNYPGSGDINFKESRVIAPFFDANGDAFYDVASGTDYPVLDPTRPSDKNKPEDQPDQMLTFVYNDKGNIHSETSGIPIGLELVTTAFGFKTNDEINNMTFYKTKITNRSRDAVRDCYFGQWVDADLGNYSDDYVGCDTSRDLGFCYNGDDDDEGILGYGTNPPSVGTDFFEGPRNEAGQELGLAKFVYYNNDFSVIGNPTLAEHYYGYLRGLWKDNSPVTYGGNGYNTGSRTDFMFPDDPAKAGGWHEKSAGNTPGDRRYIQSSGPFTLEPGAVNYVTVGVVWARATTGGATGSLSLLRLASDKAQKLFNNNFDIIDGPDAPIVQITELDRELIMTFTGTNSPRVERYSESVIGGNGQELRYRFQGYLVYQLKDASVTAADLTNIDKARLVFQCDIKDETAQIINQEFDDVVGVTVPVEKVNGSNTGIQHTFKLAEDLFAAGDKRLVNFKTYHYLIMSYAHLTNDPNDDLQFLGGRLIATGRGIPHKSEPRGSGTEIGANYGDGPAITRISGRGNGGIALELDEESENAILNASSAHVPRIKYKGGSGPFNIKVIDPFKIQRGDYELRFVDSVHLNSTAFRFQDSITNPFRSRWVLTNTTTGQSVLSDTVINIDNEQVIPQWGISLTIKQVVGPGDPDNLTDNSNGFLSASMEFENDEKPWLTGLQDNDAFATSPTLSWFNWIRAGRNGSPSYADVYAHDFANAGNPLDPRERWERMLDGRIAPYALAARAPANASGRTTYGPAYSQQPLTDNPYNELASVDIVITPDKSKWTRCAVVEMSEDPLLSLGNAEKFQLRRSPSLDKDFKPMTNGDQGRSWFPGYAINLETGERLNIIFGEDSNLPNENGTDMIWNPTGNLSSSQGIVLGGKHYFYIMGSYRAVNFKGPIYDEGATYQPMLSSNSVLDRRRVFAQAMYVMPALAETGFNLKSGIPPYEVRIRIRASKPYQNYNAAGDSINKNQPLFAFNTNDIVANPNSDNAKRSALDLIGVVPNPYYAYSQYEGSRLDNRVKFINLPQKTTIKIFTFNGTLVRTIKKDDESTSVDWDLKNQANVPIASGMYIIHVDAEGVGTKILKWFGIMRQIDLDTF
ncbi:MAG: T9SS type A sorting domain-containing protein [Bacteroidota bacterium]